MVTLPVPANLEQVWDFSSRRDQAAQPPWLFNKREQAWARLLESGFPTTRNEEWKYTSVRRVLAEAMLAPCPITGNTPLPADVTPWIDHKGPLLVFVDGVWSAEHSHVGTGGKAGQRAEVLDLATALSRYPDDLKRLMNDLEVEKSRLPTPVAKPGTESVAFQHLSDALIREGAYIRIRRSSGPTFPGTSILILHIESGCSRTISSPRTIVDIEEQAAASITEAWLAPADSVQKDGNFQPSLALPTTQIHLGAGAKLYHAQIHGEARESSQIGSTYVVSGKDSTYKSFVFTSGAKLCRKNLTVMINGEGAEVELDGLYTAGSGQHMDHHTSVDHRVPNATSNQIYKGVLLNGARAVFNGKVFVRRNAQQTSAFQSNKNLLLGDDSEVDTKPQLEIDANDVKCSHGATVARLNPDEIFYLQSRGIDRKESEDMLCYSFANDLLERIQDPSLLRQSSAILSNFFRRDAMGPGAEGEA